MLGLFYFLFYFDLYFIFYYIITKEKRTQKDKNIKKINFSKQIKSQ